MIDMYEGSILEGFHVNKPLKNYDFSGLYSICETIISKDGKISLADSNEMVKQLNKFFSDCKCITFTVSDNTDKMFFGAKVSPNVDHLSWNMYNILFNDDPVRITDYDVDIDSKLFSPFIALTPNEFVAILLHEIGHVVNTAEPIDALRVELDKYCTTNSEIVSVLQSDINKNFMAFGVAEYVSKHNSMFEDLDNETMADEFVHYYGFDRALDSIRDKIAKNGYKLSTNETSPFMSMLWTLRTYKNLATRKLVAIKTLRKAKSLAGSTLLKKNIDALIKNLSSVVVVKESGLLHKFRYNTMKQFEEDYFELAMRIKNIEAAADTKNGNRMIDYQDELEEIQYLMRKINVRISILDDFIKSEKMDENDHRRWHSCLNKYLHLRDRLYKTTIYRNSSKGVYVNYSDVNYNRAN